MATTAHDSVERLGLVTGYAALLKQDAAWWTAGQMRSRTYRHALVLTLPAHHLFAKPTGATELRGDREP